jgi:hypothetical protein
LAGAFGDVVEELTRNHEGSEGVVTRIFPCVTKMTWLLNRFTPEGGVDDIE